MNTLKYRDLTIINLPKGYLVIACDSSGSIGEKDNDFLSCPAEFVGRMSVRVPILEVMSFGAEVIGVVDTLGCEMNPTGERIINGIKRELANAGIDISCLNGSTEENMPSSMTSVGVTVIGYMDSLPSVNKICEGDCVVILGKMKMGAEVFEGEENEMATYDDVKYLKSLEYVKEVVPIGSKGVRYEAKLLAEYNSLDFKAVNGCNVDLLRSAGPATAVIAVVDAIHADDVLKLDKAKLVGKMIK